MIRYGAVASLARAAVAYDDPCTKLISLGLLNGASVSVEGRVG